MKTKLALSVAAFGGVLVCASAVYFGAGASALLTPSDPAEPAAYSGAVSSSEQTSHRVGDVETPSVAEPTTSPSPEMPAVPGSSPVPESVEVASAGAVDSIPATWSDDEIANAKVWLEQNDIVTECMDEKGYDFAYTPFWLQEPGPRVSWENSLPESEQAGATLALWGNTGAGADYHWEDAGCHGYAVHVTGMDNAN